MTLSLMDEPDENPGQRPRLAPSADGCYSHCVHCGREQFALDVVRYSAREIPCSWPDCRRYLPASYVGGTP